MSAPDNLLDLDPQSELRFIGPFNETVTSTITLHNPTKRRVCFKVKTTAPKRYCVRPNCGIVEPDQTITVSVMLQPFDFDPTEKNKHKFMIQTIYAPDGDAYINQEDFWKTAPREDVLDTKIRCVFVLPEEYGETANSNYGGGYDALRESGTPYKGSDAVTASSNANSGFATKPAPPSPQMPVKSSLSDAERQVQLEELQRLREEHMKLKLENRSLHDELAVLRASRYSHPQSSSTASGLQQDQLRASPQRVSSELLPQQPTQLFLYIIGSFTVMMLGYIMGKFIL